MLSGVRRGSGAVARVEGVELGSETCTTEDAFAHRCVLQCTESRQSFELASVLRPLAHASELLAELGIGRVLDCFYYEHLLDIRRPELLRRGARVVPYPS